MTKQDLFHIYKAGLTFKNQLMNISKIHVSQTIMVYTWKLYSDVCQLDHNKTGVEGRETAL